MQGHVPGIYEKDVVVDLERRQSARELLEHAWLTSQGWLPSFNWRESSKFNCEISRA